jgi:hypothetical protein
MCICIRKLPLLLEAYCAFGSKSGKHEFLTPAPCHRLVFASAPVPPLIIFTASMQALRVLALEAEGGALSSPFLSRGGPPPPPTPRGISSDPESRKTEIRYMLFGQVW